MKVPYSYLPQQFADPAPILEEIAEVIKVGDFTLGPRVEKFENLFSDFIGCKHAIGVGSGTDALFLSLKALGIGAGDEVITTANTFVATAGAIETAGARIRFVDCADNYVMDVSKLEAAITENTKCIMPVHYSGQPVDMDPLLKIAQKHNLKVVEDACCAIDAEVGGKRCGTIGDTGGFSLHPLKNLNIWGDGGVITTNNEEIRDKLRLLRNHGMVNRDEYAFYAYNSRLDTVQSIVGCHLIKDVKWITDMRIKFAESFDSAFSQLSDFIKIPPRPANERRVYHMYMLLVERRDELHSFLLEQGIDAKVHYPIPLHLQQASEGLGYKMGDFPVAEKQAKNIISFPVHQHLIDEQVQYTIDKVKEFYKA
ncbi:MAG: DegT/DnrJ/EryC1/StrS family aminotransferase [Bacteriovoracaceae bacterium]|jgi:dTDP-3-amino-2,3,6-trideoxy-4-keto-D-glucose/dTDP-3-amino-3,4,6-trideoxy-alpha-D-glucose/dTDP-2,6-dideoxy-D-kanosamine transaminase|nr:DegT/DnrJ/EryC1/StrS family aminotransferase [Bacteriovoracaceae bacterium]